MYTQHKDICWHNAFPETDSDLMFPECVYQDTIDVVDGDAENHGSHILHNSYVQAVPIDNCCDIPVSI